MSRSLAWTARAAAIVTLLGLSSGAALAQATASSVPGWQFRLTPYLWLPSVDATLRHGVTAGSSGVRNVDVGVDIDTNDLLNALNFAGMLAGEARHGRFALLGDVMYLNLGNSGSGVRSVDFVQAGPNPVASSLDAGTKSSLKGTLITLAGAYTVADGRWGNLDLLGGMRYLGLSARTDVRLTADVVGPGGGQVFNRSGRISDDADLIDALIGIRGQIKLGSGFFVPYLADVGTGSSTLTWQALAGIGYEARWADVTLGYRYLSYEQGKDKFIQDLSLSGPFLSAAFRF